MTQNIDQGMMEEISLPENLLPVGSVLGPGVSAMDLCMVLAKIFRVQYTEVALLRLEGGQLRFVYDDAYRSKPDSTPLSLSMPRQVASHSDGVVRP